MGDALAQYRMTVVESTEQGKSRVKHTTICPICKTQNSLRQVSGMLLCTHCFWAIELQ